MHTYALYIMGLPKVFASHLWPQGLIPAKTYKQALVAAKKLYPQQHTSRFRLERV